MSKARAAKSQVPHWTGPPRRVEDPEPVPLPLPCECRRCLPSCRRSTLPPEHRRRVAGANLCGSCDRGSHWIGGKIIESPSRARRRINRANRP